MKKAPFILFLVFCLSCQKEKKNPFIGNWYFDQVVDYDSTKSNYPQFLFQYDYGSTYNFEIINDSILDYKEGFYYPIANKYKDENDYQKFLRNYYYLGTKTNYKIHESNILFFDKTGKSWDTMKVHKISTDTMVIQGYEDALFRLVRKQNNFFDDKSYDAITVDRSLCFGSCPSNATYIDRKGNFFFKPYFYNTDYNNLMGQLEQETINYYFNLFDKIPITTLKDSYFVPATDSQTNTISFFKNGKIVKTISCYIENPTDLKKAYEALSYAYQNVKVDYDNHFLFENYVSFSRFTNGKDDYRLKESEGFFIEIALRQGQEVNTEINPLYELNFSLLGEKSDVKKITTDGRYYLIVMNDGTTKTIDIGYNFIDKNPLIKKNREL